MSTGKALLYALGVTAVSALLLTVANGMPTAKQLVGGSIMMFGVALFVFKSVKVS